MTLGLAVCTYRRPEGLARLLAALPGATSAALTVLVIDNDGTDPRVAAVLAAAGLPRRITTALHVEPTPGISAARERAFAEAAALGLTRLALLDDDEWPASGWLDKLLARQAATGAAVVGGPVEACLPPGSSLAALAGFWAVRPQSRAGRPFVHATSNVLIDLTALSDVPRPLFDPECGLSGGGDLVFFSRLFDLGKPMTWAEDAGVFEEIPPARASLAWLRQRRFRVGNHMVMDEARRAGRLRPIAHTAVLCLRLPFYPLGRREAESPALAWRLEAAKVAGRIAAHRGLRAYDYARDGIRLRPAAPTAAKAP